MNKTGVLCLFVLLGLLAAFAPAGQAQDLLSPPGEDEPSVNPLARFAQASASSLALEGSLDPEVYLVGPGDQFQIAIGGAQPILVTVPVAADGRLTLPEGGSVQVAGETLAAARATITERLRIPFRNVSLEVSLLQPRRFYVHVSGAVPTPGRFLASPVTRVSDVLEVAFADTAQASVSNTAYQPSLRNILVTRRDSSTESIDLLRYFTTGDPHSNVFLHDGDIIRVPAYNPDVDAVFVNGDVAFPGTYEHRPGDTVLDLLVLSAGTASLDGLGRVRIARRGADGAVQTILLDVADLLGGAAPVPVEPRDQLSVAPRRIAAGTASAEGALAFPGVYPIEKGVTTLQDLVEMAGGLHPEALARGAYLERAALPRSFVTPGPRGRFDTSGGAARLLRPDSLALQQRLRLADFDPFTRTYFSQEARLQNRVSLDLAEALAPGGAPIYLENGDRLVVPHDDRTVYVFGQVNRPGYVPYRPGTDAEAYLRAAGGLSPLASDVYVVEAGTGRYLPADSAAVGSGDLIFVDRRADVLVSAAQQQLKMDRERFALERERFTLDRDRFTLEEERLEEERRNERRDARFRVTQVAVQVLGMAASIISTYLLLERTQNNNN